MRQHDQPVKLLLQTFFVEFLAAFARDIYRDLDPKSVQFLDKELIHARRGRHLAKVVDLVVRVKLRGEEGFVLMHIEHQGQRDRRIGLRLFLYAALLSGTACRYIRSCLHPTTSPAMRSLIGSRWRCEVLASSISAIG